MTSYLESAMAIVREAGLLLRERFGRPQKIEYKGRINIVTEADHASEDLIINKIRALYPNHDIMTEESRGVATGADYRWIVDPLDGTTNYAHGYPVFCVSLALERRGTICCGAVYNPMLNEMFCAERGGGAHLNGEKIRVSATTVLSESLLATGFPYDIRESDENNISYFNYMAVNAQAIRRAGSAALDMAYVAAGRFDGFWELKLMPWDTAAAWLLITEAGGSVTDLFGEPFSLQSPHVLASNGIIHGDMKAVLSRSRHGEEK
ncbi:MAG: inositol monophosphatase family protein [Syntrophales bacterium]|jgi:myo-inositol-1(or 4)-monophosphatase|nr:inositol monophosphatase family protein [Syntrophales bacterium]